MHRPAMPAHSDFFQVDALGSLHISSAPGAQRMGDSRVEQTQRSLRRCRAQPRDARRPPPAARRAAPRPPPAARRPSPAARRPPPVSVARPPSSVRVCGRSAFSPPACAACGRESGASVLAVQGQQNTPRGGVLVTGDVTLGQGSSQHERNSRSKGPFLGPGQVRVAGQSPQARARARGGGERRRPERWGSCR